MIIPCQDGMSRRIGSCPIIYTSSTDARSCADTQCVMHSSARRARRSVYAGLLLCFMPVSPEAEAAFPEQAQALYAGFQELYQHPAAVDDVCRYPSVGRNAYNEEDVRWFEATYDYLEAQLDDAELAKRMLPTKKQRRGGRSATSAPAAPAVPSPAAAAGTRTTPRAACADDTEDEDAPVFATPGTRKRGRKAR